MGRHSKHSRGSDAGCASGPTIPAPARLLAEAESLQQRAERSKGMECCERLQAAAVS